MYISIDSNCNRLTTLTPTHIRGVRLDLQENIMLNVNSKVALIGFKMNLKNSILKCLNNLEGIQQLNVINKVVNICSDVVKLSPVNDFYLPVLNNIFITDDLIVDINFPKPIYHPLNISCLNGINVYFMDMDNRLCFISDSDYFHCTFDVVI